MLIRLVAIILYASSLAAVISSFLTSKLQISFFASSFSREIPTYSLELARDKSYDLLYFGLIVLFSVFISIIYLYFLKIQNRKNIIVDFFNLAFAILFFVQTHFVRYSYTEILIIFIVIQVIYMFLKIIIKKEIDFSGWLTVGNSFLTGFFCMLFVRQITTSMLLTLGTILLIVFLYQISSGYFIKKYLTHPCHLILFLAIINSWNLYYLLSLGLFTFLSILFIKKFPEKIIDNLNFIYSLVFIAFFAYNPLFYFGNIDTVEEGFWLGWLQRLSTGQILYKDVFVFHPPLMIWGLNSFVSIFGESLYWFRLYFHTLNVIGILLIFVCVRSFINKKANLFLYILLLLSFITPYLRNNVEIRVGLGIFALYLLFQYFTTNKKIWLIFSGIISSLSFFVSSEVGIASLIACSISILIKSPGLIEFIKKMAIWLTGVLSITAIIVGILYMQGALNEFISQMYFYSNAFSNGYFNLTIERIESQNILQWWKIDEYLSSTAFFWEIAWFSLAAGIIFFIYRLITKSFEKRDSIVFMILLFNLILSRAALGRSDGYHLLFILISLIPLLIYFLEYFEKEFRYKFISSVVLIIFLLVFFRSEFQRVFINNELFKLQSYANISQRYNILQSPRAKIALDIDYPVKDIDSLIEFIDNNTTKTDKIFIYPWQPEIYFLTDRNNATSFDTPYASFTSNYQEQMVSELRTNKPKYIIYNTDISFGEMELNSLPIVNEFILNNYKIVNNFGKNNIMVSK